jgi:hypothetical protein
MLFTISSSNSGEDGEAGERDGKGAEGEGEGEEEGRMDDEVEEEEDDEGSAVVDEEEEVKPSMDEGTSSSLPSRVTDASRSVDSMLQSSHICDCTYYAQALVAKHADWILPLSPPLYGCAAP